jgi:AcrR family transcriptional regulator
MMGAMTAPDDAPRLGLRERKKQATRRELTAVALRLFAERGFDQVTVEEIADAAQASPRTFYRYFADKSEVLFGEDDRLMAVLRGALAERPPGEPPLEVARHGARALTAALAEVPELLARQRLVAETPALAARDATKRARWEREVTDALAVRLAEPAGSLRARLLAGAWRMCLEAAAALWLESDGRADPLALIDAAFDLVDVR